MARGYFKAVIEEQDLKPSTEQPPIKFHRNDTPAPTSYQSHVWTSSPAFKDLSWSARTSPKPAGEPATPPKDENKPSNDEEPNKTAGICTYEGLINQKGRKCYWDHFAPSFTASGLTKH